MRTIRYSPRDRTAANTERNAYARIDALGSAKLSAFITT